MAHTQIRTCIRMALFTTLTCLAMVTMGVSDAVAQAPPIRQKLAQCNDPPLPDPCAVEGVCRPRRETFGFYSTRWREWPGAAGDVDSATAEEQQRLNAVPDIPVKEEDREAPPPSEDRAPRPAEQSFPQPDLPPLPPALQRRPPTPADNGDGELPPLPRLLRPSVPPQTNRITPPALKPFTHLTASPKATGPLTPIIKNNEATSQVAPQATGPQKLGETAVKRERIAVRLPAITPAGANPLRSLGAANKGNSRWSRAGEKPPQLPNALVAGLKALQSDETPSGETQPGETVSSYPVPTKWGRSTANQDHTAIQPATAQAPASQPAARALYEPAGAPVFIQSGSLNR